jgi:Tfp pilus assembly protein PilO
MKSRGPIVAAAVSLLAAVVVVVALIFPKTNEVKTTQKAVTAEQAKTAQLQLQVDQLKTLEKQASKIRAELKALNIEVPPTADLPGLIHEVNGAADQAAVDLQSITPGSPAAATSNPVSVIPLQLTVSGGYFSVEEFLYRIETLDRTAKVATVSLTPDGGSSSTDSGQSSSSPKTPPNLTAVVMVNFFTTDMESGPGSSFGHQGGTDTTTGDSSTTTTTTTGSETAS